MNERSASRALLGETRGDGTMKRVSAFLAIMAGLRRHDFRAARTWLGTMHPGRPLPIRLVLFVGWFLRAAWRSIPDAAEWTSFAEPVARTPIWLADGNPFDSHPFAGDPGARLPEEAEVVVIGAGFAGAAVAYHWCKRGEAALVVLEKEAPAAGSAGRNQGLVVMGRYYHMVHGTVLRYLERARPDLSAPERDRRAHGSAEAYARAAYANAELIERTIREEGIDCEYVRGGWVQAVDKPHLGQLIQSTEMARETGFTDWTDISAEEAVERSGIRTPLSAGYSAGAATWHPAKWVWGLLRIALASPHVRLFTKTRVLRVEDHGDGYTVHTDRGTVRARHVVNATESQSPQLFREMHGVILPVQTQAAYGPSDGGTMKSGVGISGPEGFFGRHRDGVLCGSDATRVPDREAGANRPSRFITKFLLTQLKSCFGAERIRVTNEWSGTVSYTPDEYPLVGLMDGKRLYIIGGMAGSGSAVSFNAGRHVVQKILGIEGPDYYPEEYFSPARFSGAPPVPEKRKIGP
jgi:glycine/D-amino acid oxidase-like deaminating enzyme